MRPRVPVLLLVVLAWLAPTVPSHADVPPADPPAPPAQEPAPAPASPEPEAPALAVGVIQGERVNLRIGPRQDGRAVAQLDDGAVVVIVERLGEWLGVRVPQGFPAAIALAYAEPEGADALRVAASNVNLRLHPPEEGKPQPPSFRDRPARGAVLTLIETAGEWAWVVAPEDVRVYVSSRFVRDLGPLDPHAAAVAEARAKREADARRLSEARRGQMSEKAGRVLIAEVGAVQEALYRLRVEGNQDKTPVVQLADRLDQALAAGSLAPGRILAIARALREDLEAEIAITVARRDAEMARLKGLPPPIVSLPAPKKDLVEVTGIIEYEETPGWKEKGVFLLWVEGRPVHALRLTTGGQLPHPDLRANADGHPRKIQGTQPGERLFGFPVLDVKSVQPVP